MGSDWRRDLERWLMPFLAALGHKARARMCPAYVAGLIGIGERKSVQPMALRDGGVGYDQLHHFVSAGVWDAAPLEQELVRQADALLGGDEAFLIIDDTALPKKGTHSVGVAPGRVPTRGVAEGGHRRLPVRFGLRDPTLNREIPDDRRDDDPARAAGEEP